MSRWLTVTAAAFGLLAGAAAPGVSNAAEACDGVWVVVDARQLGGSITTHCAPGDPTSGLDALRAAGHAYDFVPRVPGMVCVIDGRPDPCNGAPADAYWSYWHAQAGGSWTYSSRGAGQRDPAPGEVEGWAFGSGTPPSAAPPAPREAAPAPKPEPEPEPKADMEPKAPRSDRSSSRSDTSSPTESTSGSGSTGSGSGGSSSKSSEGSSGPQTSATREAAPSTDADTDNTADGRGDVGDASDTDADGRSTDDTDADSDDSNRQSGDPKNSSDDDPPAAADEPDADQGPDTRPGDASDDRDTDDEPDPDAAGRPDGPVVSPQDEAVLAADPMSSEDGGSLIGVVIGGLLTALIASAAAWQAVRRRRG